MAWNVQAHRRIACPTCRARTAVSQIAYVDGGRSQPKGAGCSSGGGEAEEGEGRIEVKGSYGTKARFYHKSPRLAGLNPDVMVYVTTMSTLTYIQYCTEG